MNNIVIVTPPDVLNNDAFNICLIHPRNELKEILHNILTQVDININVFLYELNVDYDVAWLLNVVKSSNVVLIDLDNCDILTKAFSSHIIAQPNTFYLTNDNYTPYNIISKNRIYDLTWLEDILVNRGNNE
jgi:hypothetical protein